MPKRNLLIALTITLAIFLCLEGGTRLYLLKSSTRGILAKWPVLALYPNIERPEEIFSSVTQESIEWSPYEHWIIRPNLRSRFYRTNALGFRGPETPFQKPKGRFRVVVIGGSAAWGFGCTTDERTLPGRLQAILREQYSGLDLEVINAGQIGYGSAQELIYYHRLIAPMAPDLVLVFDGYNDVLADFTNPVSGWPLHSDLLKARYEDSFRPHPLRKDMVGLLRQSRFLDLLMRRLSNKMAATWPAISAIPPGVTAENYIRNVLALARLAAPAPVWIALQPVPACTQKALALEERRIIAEKEQAIFHYVDRVRSTYQAFETGIRAAGLPVINLERALGTEPQLMFADECHFGDEAAARIAVQIANEWSRAKVILETVGNNTSSQGSTK